jgi:tripartite-type tricarboxylate transporter receptor subunit TctC
MADPLMNVCNLGKSGNGAYAITSDPAFRSRMATAGSAARSGTPAEFAAAIEEQRVKIAAIKTIQPPAR